MAKTVNKVKHGYQIDSSCLLCGKDNPPVIMTNDEYRSYNQGVVIQVAAPGLTKQEREYCISGLCSGCY